MILRSTEAKVKLIVPVFFGLSLIASSASGEAEAVRGRAVHLNLRTRVQPFKTILHWNKVDFQEEFLLSETAIVICDMWDSHWCTGAARRVDILARKMAPVIDEARNRLRHWPFWRLLVRRGSLEVGFGPS